MGGSIFNSFFPSDWMIQLCTLTCLHSVVCDGIWCTRQCLGRTSVERGGYISASTSSTPKSSLTSSSSGGTPVTCTVVTFCLLHLLSCLDQVWICLRSLGCYSQRRSGAVDCLFVFLPKRAVIEKNEETVVTVDNWVPAANLGRLNQVSGLNQVLNVC